MSWKTYIKPNLKLENNNKLLSVYNNKLLSKELFSYFGKHLNFYAFYQVLLNIAIKLEVS